MAKHCVNRVLIVGGGFSGMSAGIQLVKLGINVDLVEVDPDWRCYGAGISLGAATIRAFKTLGIFDEFLRLGACVSGMQVFTGDGTEIARVKMSSLDGLDIPGDSGGIMRPVLAKILSEATLAAGVNVRLGCTFTQIDEVQDGVTVAFTDGSQQTYDLVIGADGLFSKVRETCFSNAGTPHYTGQSAWRCVLPRPKGMVSGAMWLGEQHKVGINAVSQDEIYMYVLENLPTKTFIPESEWEKRLKAILADFPAPALQAFRAQIGPRSLINFRPLEGLLVPAPWHSGRVVLMGDAVHATTPHLAMGAGIGIEDALVLAEEISVASDVNVALQRYMDRRWERCRMVVENSLRLGEIEIHNGDKAEHAKIMAESLASLCDPI